MLPWRLDENPYSVEREWQKVMALTLIKGVGIVSAGRSKGTPLFGLNRLARVWSLRSEVFKNLQRGILLSRILRTVFFLIFLDRNTFLVAITVS